MIMTFRIAAGFLAERPGSPAGGRMSRGHCRAVKPAGQVQPMDTDHGLVGMGKSLSQMW
jgi:hypothetical protein